jgi:hypothetical protein
MRPNPREMADGLIEVRLFGCARFQNATREDIVTTFPDTMTLYVHSGNDQFYLAPDYERYSRPSASTRSICYILNDFGPE